MSDGVIRSSFMSDGVIVKHFHFLWLRTGSYAVVWRFLSFPFSVTPLRLAHVSHAPGEYFAKLAISANSAQNRGSIQCINLLKSIVYVSQVQSTVKGYNYCIIYLRGSIPTPIGVF